MTCKEYILPGGGSPRLVSTSPTFKVVRSLRKPSRRRARIFSLVILACFVVLTLTVKRHCDYGKLLSNGFSVGTSSDADLAKTSEDTKIGINLTESKPTLHLLIPAQQSSLDICKTLLSAAVLNYPPPTLIGYGSEDTGQPVEVSILHSLSTMQPDDIVLLADQYTWFQLPAEVIMSRYINHQRSSNQHLLDRYGEQTDITANVYGELPKGTAFRGPVQTYREKVIFAANKLCQPYSVGDVACQRHQPDKPTNISASGPPEVIDYQSPRYIGTHGAIGRVADLIPIYKRAITKIGENAFSAHGSQAIFSEIFAAQEARREDYLKSNKPTWRQWLTKKLRIIDDIDASNPSSETLAPNMDDELGIGIDSRSSIFQAMYNSIGDVDFFAFDQETVEDAHSHHLKQLQLPPDLNHTTPPFVRHHEIESRILELHPLPEDRQWTDVELASNIHVPRGSVPAALRFNSVDTLLEKWWPKMWYQKHARALLHRYMSSPQTSAAAKAAAKGGDSWWDLRGGTGGVWTDQGEWLEWSEVCGNYDDALFLDDKGAFGEEEGKNPVYNSFGSLVAESP